MIASFSAQNFGCLNDVNCALTPLHAFIGPNDSGKSTLLRAIGAALGMRPASWPGKTQVGRVRLGFPGGRSRLVLFNGATRLDSDPQGGLGSDNGPDGPFSMWTDLQDAEEQWCRRGAALVRLDADAIREPSPLLTNLSQLDLAGDRGRGLPGMLDYLRDRDEAAFTSIREDVYRLFPAVQYLSLKAVEQYETAGKGAFPVQRKVIQIRLKDGTEVDADRISEGLLYYLAYRALQHVSPAAVLLVEEPENGLHPARVVEVVGVLRKISEGGTQVVVATHSPLVVNELSPAEVSLVTRPDATGTVVTPIARTPGFDSRAKVYALGELWLNYADGKDESALINGGPRPGVLAP